MFQYIFSAFTKSSVLAVRRTSLSWSSPLCWSWWADKLFLQKVLGLLNSRSSQKCLSSTNLVTEIQLSKEPRALSSYYQKSFEHWKTMHVKTCYFAPVISQGYIKYTLVHSSKHLAYLFHVRLIQMLFKDCHV